MSGGTGGSGGNGNGGCCVASLAGVIVGTLDELDELDADELFVRSKKDGTLGRAFANRDRFVCFDDGGDGRAAAIVTEFWGEVLAFITYRCTLSHFPESKQ